MREERPAQVVVGVRVAAGPLNEEFVDQFGVFIALRGEVRRAQVNARLEALGVELHGALVELRGAPVLTRLVVRQARPELRGGVAGLRRNDVFKGDERAPVVAEAVERAPDDEDRVAARFGVAQALRGGFGGAQRLVGLGELLEGASSREVDCAFGFGVILCAQRPLERRERRFGLSALQKAAP